MSKKRERKQHIAQKKINQTKRTRTTKQRCITQHSYSDHPRVHGHVVVVVIVIVIVNITTQTHERSRGGSSAAQRLSDSMICAMKACVMPGCAFSALSNASFSWASAVTVGSSV